ncbi:MAG: DNA photolyase [Deltaproteobacteria bacterium]|uniref:DNA photolyase n=1 Tax=Candidatus Zymogenus saltonus TaxID=2844893 RepID=A0A9D8KEL6_9DELT|nr:DNA photolyase [Candidatus Zymogenus saltonus]
MYGFENIYVEEGARGFPLTERVLGRLGSEAVVVSDFRDIPKAGEGKKSLVLALHKGRIVKNCPGTVNHICCGYHVINQVLGCDVDCTYCILNCYINAPGVVINVNLDDTISELDRVLDGKRKYIYRVGTGELTDSFYLEDLTGLAAGFVQYFADKKNVLFELKTKKTDIDGVLDLDHRGRTIISWSLNAGPVAGSEEAGAAPIMERLKAAGRAQRRGYYIGFHFDPIVHYDGWESGYDETARAIFDFVDPKKILWISLGTFRSPPHLFEIIRRRHPKSAIVTGESFPGDDGKLRYIKPLRVEMYRRLLKSLKRYGGDDLFVYLCMERRDVWEKVYGGAFEIPKNSGDLDRMFHENLKSKWIADGES